jgi:hypothetical protein
VLVASAVPLLDAGEVEERGGEGIGWKLAALDLLPRLGVVGDVVTDPEVAGADRVEHPAGSPLHPFGDHGSTLRATRAM